MPEELNEIKSTEIGLGDVSVEIAAQVDENVYRILTSKLSSMESFNSDNYNKNAWAFKKVLLDDVVYLRDGVPFSDAYYAIAENTMYISKQNFSATLLCHEMLHMASASREKNITGYASDPNLLVFNEAATQWLTLSAFSPNAKVSNVPDGNKDYVYVTNLFGELVEKYGEDKMYNGYFEADFDKFISGLSEEGRVEVNKAIELMNENCKVYDVLREKAQLSLPPSD